MVVVVVVVVVVGVLVVVVGLVAHTLPNPISVNNNFRFRNREFT